MAGVSTTMLNGSRCILKIGDLKIATAQAVNFSEQVANQFVRAMGSMGPVALEPLQYGASASLVIQKYSQDVLTGFGAPESPLKPAVLKDSKNPFAPGRLDGNSLNFFEYASPLHMLLATTFDVEVMAQQTAGGAYDKRVFILRDCRLTGYSTGVQANGLVSENINLFVRFLQEPEVEAIKNNIKGDA